MYKNSYYLFDYDLLSNKQFCFVPNRSSNIQLLTYFHSWLVPYLKNEKIKTVYLILKKLSILYNTNEY